MSITGGLLAQSIGRQRGEREAAEAARKRQLEEEERQREADDRQREIAREALAMKLGEFNLEQAQRRAAQPMEPIEGSPEWEKNLRTRARIDAEFRTPSSTPSPADRRAAEARAAVNTDIENRRDQLNLPGNRLPTRSIFQDPATPEGARFTADSSAVAARRGGIEQALEARMGDYSRLTDEAIGRQPSGAGGGSEHQQALAEAKAAYEAGPDTLERRRMYGRAVAAINAKFNRPR